MKENKNQKNTAVNQITEGVIWKQLLLFFFPILFGTLFQQIYNTADTVVVGRFVGKEALAAVGGSSSMIVNLIVGFFVGLCSGAAVVISQFYGAKDHKNLKKALHTSMIFCLAASIIVGTAGFILAEPILYLMKTPAEVIPDSVLYLHIYFAGTFFNLVYNMVSSILRAVGDSKRPLYVLIITCLLNILLDVVFVVIFHMGVLGVALATVSCQAVSAILVTWFLMRAEDIYRLEFHEIRFDLRSLGAVLRIGLPAGLESVMYNIANLTIQIFVNELGTDTVAAWGTLGKIDAVFWMVCNAFAISITTFVGQNYGAGKYHRMRKSVRVCMAMAYYRIYCKWCNCSVCGTNLPPIYHRSDSGENWSPYDPVPDPIVCALCCDRNSVRRPAWCRKSSDPHDSDMRRRLHDPDYLAVCLCKIPSRN